MKKGIILIILLCSILIFDNVKASNYESQWIPNSSYSVNWGSQWNNANNDSSNYYNVSDSISISESPSNYWFRFEDSNKNPISYSLNGVEYMTFTIKMNIQNSGFNENSCTINSTWKYVENNGVVDGEYEYTGFTCNGYEKSVEYGIDVNYFYNDSTSQLRHCDIISQVGWNLNVQCPVSTDNISGIRISMASHTDNFLSYNIGYYFTYTKKISGTQQIIEHNTNYDYNATKDYGNQTNEMDNITNAEDTLMNNLDFNTTDMNITINPNASTFIWNIVDALRLMSTKIVLLMTSILSIGVIKLVLNR